MTGVQKGVYDKVIVMYDQMNQMKIPPKYVAALKEARRRVDSRLQQLRKKSPNEVIKDDELPGIYNVMDVLALYDVFREMHKKQQLQNVNVSVDAHDKLFYPSLTNKNFETMNLKSMRSTVKALTFKLPTLKAVMKFATDHAKTPFSVTSIELYKRLEKLGEYDLPPSVLYTLLFQKVGGVFYDVTDHVVRKSLHMHLVPPKLEMYSRPEDSRQLLRYLQNRKIPKADLNVVMANVGKYFNFSHNDPRTKKQAFLKAMRAKHAHTLSSPSIDPLFFHELNEMQKEDKAKKRDLLMTRLTK